jgi:hypothetical protein
MVSQAQLERNMKIAEIYKIANKKLDENLPKKQYDALNKEVTKAKELVAAFEKYKPMLKAEKKILKWFEKHTINYGLICTHGDLDNVWICNTEKNVLNLNGELIENVDSELVECGCSKHNDSVVCIDEFCDAVDGIDEFNELVKCLSKHC